MAATDNIVLTLVLTVALSLPVSSGWAGNQEMVQETVVDMDELNKKILESLEEAPANGKIEIEAIVYHEEGSPVFDIHQKKITSEKDAEIDFHGSRAADSQEEGGKKSHDKQ